MRFEVELGMLALIAAVSALALGGRTTVYTEPWHQSLSLSAGGEVEVDNLSGDVDVRSGAVGTVEINAVKKAYAQADLSGINVHVDAISGAIKITSDFPPAWRGLHRIQRWVDYIIAVPKGTKVVLRLKYGDGRIENIGGQVDAQSRYGDVDARGASGEDNLSSEYGDVRLSVLAINPSQRVTMHTTYGDVELHLPASATPKVSAVTRIGKVKNDFEGTTRNGPVVELRTTFGDIVVGKEIGP